MGVGVRHALDDMLADRVGCKGRRGLRLVRGRVKSWGRGLGRGRGQSWGWAWVRVKARVKS